MEIVRIIIADDHVIFRKGLRAILNEITEFKVIAEAANGIELLEMLKNQETDVVLMDIKMPEMDGLLATKQILEKVKEKKLKVKIILVTVVRFSDEEKAALMRNTAVVDYVPKPFDVSELMDKITRHLKEKK